MYAVVKTGGKQYRVSKDDTIMVEFIKAEAGSTIYLDNVMMLNNNGDLTIGTPKVDGALVSAKVVKQARGPKLIIFRRKRRKNHRRTQGHRQDLTLLKIIDIIIFNFFKTNIFARYINHTKYFICSLRYYWI